MRILRAIRDKYIANIPTALSRASRSRNLTYGELEPCFVYGLLDDLRVARHSVLVDLGSGAGTFVIQAAIQTGCTAFGIELQTELADIAADAVINARSACAARHINIGQVTLVQGDMLASCETAKAMSKADVVMVNNKVFDSTLNESILIELVPLMKHGAVIVSTERFIDGKATRSGRSCPHGRSLEVVARPYQEGSVSWSHSSGIYFIHTVYDADDCRSRQAYASAKYAC
uniref:Histone-lysine N-methyltransferase, H3 lysine-79 specific n=1 Tax=Schizophyllum commune (strain H4-8 / FGSC 9210) TaxID=578458 RepID=D8PY62_SCHCM